MQDSFKDLYNDLNSIERLINNLECKKCAECLSDEPLTIEEEQKLKRLYEYERYLVFLMAKSKGVLDYSRN